MLQDLLHVSDASVKYGRAVFLLLLAATQAAATRSFVQVTRLLPCVACLF